jgi:hypothetical protein
MKTQTLASFVWNTWKGKPAKAPSKFVPTSYKSAPLIKSRIAPATAKKADLETAKVRKQTQKLTAELISKTQHLDPCFATLWRRTI